MDAMRARYAAEVFLAAMRREWIAANPDSNRPCPVKRLEDYDSTSQKALTRSLRAAVRSADEDQDSKFQRFSERLQEVATQ